MTSEDLNLPASLERLEINPENKLDCCKTDEKAYMFGVKCLLRESPECSLETLSLNAICPKGSCLCNKKKDGLGRNNTSSNINGTSGLKSIVHHRRPILRRSKLNREVLRAPILKLGGNETGTDVNSIGGKSSTSYKTIDGGGVSTINNTSDSICYRQSPLTAASSISSNTIGGSISTGYKSSTYIAAASSAATSSHCCALQARNFNNNNTSNSSTNTTTSSTPTADDLNIDELASYFDLFVHIPKKMSVMAEMMYI